MKFSIGWLQNFLNRNNFSYKKRTTTCFINENIITKKINEEFFPELYSYILDNPNKTIFYNMEEIRIELDSFQIKLSTLKELNMNLNKKIFKTTTFI